MTTRRFAVRTQQRCSRQAGDPEGVARSLRARLEAQAGRPPLDVALPLALGLVRAVAASHARGHRVGGLDAAGVQVTDRGEVRVLSGPARGVAVEDDVHAVGGLLFQLFTGLTLRQARASLGDPAAEDLPGPARWNPGLDDRLDTLVARLCAHRASVRPQSMAQVEAWLLLTCEDMELDAGDARLARWAAAAPRSPLALGPARGFVASEADDEADDDEVDAPRAPAGPVRLDAWAVAAAGFAVVAFALVTSR